MKYKTFSYGSVGYDFFVDEYNTDCITVSRSRDHKGHFHSAQINWSAFGAKPIEFATEFREALAMAIEFANWLNNQEIKEFVVYADITNADGSIRTFDDEKYAPSKDFLLEIYNDSPNVKI